MKCRTIIFFATLYLCMYSLPDVYAQNLPKFRIDPSKVYGGSVSEYVNSVEYIPLETTKESLFGQIERLVITDSSFVIIDRDTRSVLFFDEKGKFLVKRKCGSASFPRIFYFNEIGVVCIFCTDANGKVRNNNKNTSDFQFLSTRGETISNPGIYAGINTAISNMVPLGNDYFLSLKSCMSYTQKDIVKDTSVGLAEIYRKDNSLYKSVINTNPKEDILFCSVTGGLMASNVIENNEMYLSKGLSHIVYRVNKDTAIKSFQLVFPTERSLQWKDEDLQSKKKIEELNKKIGQNTNIVTHVSNIHFKGTKLFLKLNFRYYPVTESTDALFQYNLIYDTLSKKTVSLERLSPDKTNYFLPLSGRRASVNGLDYYKGFFYTEISSYQMFNSYEKRKKVTLSYPEFLKQYFKSQTKKSNPVLVKMSFKK